MKSLSLKRLGHLACIAVLGIAYAASTAAGATEEDVEILYYERVVLIESTIPAAGAQPTGSSALVFDAFGRRFELILNSPTVAIEPDFEQLKGQVRGSSNSWFQLLRHGEELSGIIVDGDDTWMIDQARRIRDNLANQPSNELTGNLIYRLADVLAPPGLLACASANDVVDVAADAQTSFSKLKSELTAAATTANSQSSTPTITLGTVADDTFVAFHGPDSEQEVITYLNVVNGIFLNQVDIDITMADFVAVGQDITNPFTNTNSGSDLLNELRNWRSINQANLGITHLVTNRALVNENGNSIAGIAFLGSPGGSGICSPTSGASLSRKVSSLTALIIAHELGHGFGSPHDGDPDEICAAESPFGSIMSASISPSTAANFSQCSIGEMQKVIDAASCLGNSASVTTTPPGSSGGGGGGGGGVWGIWSLLALLLIGLRGRAH